MWAACYGRCLAEQTGFFKAADTAWHCEGGCCEESDGDQPPLDPNPPCKLCDFIKSGGGSLFDPAVVSATLARRERLEEVHRLVTPGHGSA